MPIPIPARPSVVSDKPYPLQDILRKTAARLPDKVAVIDGDRTFTFRQLHDLSDRLATALVESGVGPGDRVGLLAPNCVELGACRTS